MEKPVKPNLRDRLSDRPFLQYLVTDYWVAIVGGLLALGVAGVLASFLKIWPVPSPGVQRTIKISGIDYLQAASLARNAVKLEAKGKLMEASYGWLGAIANHPGHLGHIRGALEFFARVPREAQFAPMVMQQAFWLVQLGGMKESDVVLAARVCARERQPESLQGILAKLNGPAPLEAESLLVGTLFEAGDAAKFAETWARLESRLLHHAPARVYHDAFLAGWSAGEQAGEARRRLQAAAGNPETKVRAWRAQLIAAFRLNDHGWAAQALEALDSEGQSDFADHLRYWKLLGALGRQEQARDLAAASDKPPTTAFEAMEAARIFFDAGDTLGALKRLESARERFERASEFWLAYPYLLLQFKQWDALERTALELRSMHQLSGRFIGFSHYLEGRVELGRDHPAEALNSFKNAASIGFPNAMLSLQVASDLEKLRHPELARDILARLKGEFPQDKAFWRRLSALAHTLRDEALLQEATSKCMELEPDSSEAKSRYLTALVRSRQKPLDAIRLSLESIAINQSSSSARLNHTQALLLNQRWAEAEMLLHRIDIKPLGQAEQSFHQLQLVEANVGLGRLESAARALARVETGYLFPSELRWLEEARKMLPSPRAEVSKEQDQGTSRTKS